MVVKLYCHFRLGQSYHVRCSLGLAYHFENLRPFSAWFGQTYDRVGRRCDVIVLTSSVVVSTTGQQTTFLVTAVRQYRGIHVHFQLLWVEMLCPPCGWNIRPCTPVIAPSQATSALASYPTWQLLFVHVRLLLLTVYSAVRKRKRKKIRFRFFLTCFERRDSSSGTLHEWETMT